MEFYKFPYSHYKFKVVKPQPELPYRGRVIAISTYKKKPVRGVAICDFHDEFDVERGKKLAALRCNAKVALKRYDNAREKYTLANKEYEAAKKNLQHMAEYRACAEMAYNKARGELTAYHKDLMDE